MSDLRELALRNIGRNLVKFQKMEGMLKLLLTHSNFQSPVSSVLETLKEREKQFENKTLGHLVGEHVKSFNNDMDHLHHPEGSNESWMSLSLKIGNEEGRMPEQKAEWEFLVSERNRLVHQMLVKFDPGSDESCGVLIKELDKQNEMIQREYKNLQTLLEAFFVARKELLERMAQRPKDVGDQTPS